MSDEETIAVYDKQAETYDNLVSRDKPDQDLRRFLDAVPVGGRVLDLGCGPGNSSAMMQDAGLVVEATDASAKMVEMARSKYGVDAQQARFADLEAVDRFDGIWANFSLLHAPRSDFPTHLDQISKALMAGGFFHIGMKLGEDAGRDDIGRQYTYYSEAELKQLVKQAGFTVEFSRTDKGKGLSGRVDGFVILLSRKPTDA